MKLIKKTMQRLGLLTVMGLFLISEADFKQALAEQQIDVYVVYSGKDKKDKTALKKAFPSNLAMKFYNVDLLALADYSGKQKAIAKLENASVIVLVSDSPHDLLDGTTLKKDLVIFKSAKNGVKSEGKTLYIVSKGTTLDSSLKTRRAIEAELQDTGVLNSTDALLVNGTTDSHHAVALVVSTLLGS